MSSNNSGKNIHNAFAVVYETYKSVEKLISKCQNEIDEDKYYMPTKRFLRYSSDRSWDGWIYWSFILLYQRHEDGKVMDNKWINGPVYAVEINLDADICEEPELVVAKFDFGDISDWTEGCSPSHHSIFYEPIHKVRYFESRISSPPLQMRRALSGDAHFSRGLKAPAESCEAACVHEQVAKADCECPLYSIESEEYELIVPTAGYEKKVETGYWGLKKLACCAIPLVEVNKGNYQEKIFGTIEKLSKLQL